MAEGDIVFHLRTPFCCPEHLTIKGSSLIMTFRVLTLIHAQSFLVLSPYCRRTTSSIPLQAILVSPTSIPSVYYRLGCPTTRHSDRFPGTPPLFGFTLTLYIPLDALYIILFITSIACTLGLVLLSISLPFYLRP